MHPATTHLLRLFEFVAEVADQVVREIVEWAGDSAEMGGQVLGPELSTALRKLVEAKELVEAKDCAVRQAVIDSKEQKA